MGTGNLRHRLYLRKNVGLFSAVGLIQLMKAREFVLAPPWSSYDDGIWIAQRLPKNPSVVLSAVARVNGSESIRKPQGGQL